MAANLRLQLTSSILGFRVAGEAHRWAVVARFLTPDQAGEELLNYAHHHSLAMRELAHFKGYRLDGSLMDIHALGQALSMVAFQPI